MVQGSSTDQRYQVSLSNGKHQIIADASAGKGGDSGGFRPHELLEAALAACINMTVRMYADRHGIALSSACASVTLDRTHPEETMFLCALELKGDLSQSDRKRLEAAVDTCPVSRTLGRRISFDTMRARTG